MKELVHLQERARRLAEEEAHLQLIISMMERLSTVPGLDTTVDNMLRIVQDTIGGTNLAIYYRIDSGFICADAFGNKARLDVIDDDLVSHVFDTRTIVERDHDVSDTSTMTPGPETCVYPLLVGSELIGVFRIEGIHVQSRGWRKVLPTFFNYAALVLKSEILGHTKLMQARDQLCLADEVLTKEISDRTEMEEALQVALVKYRTLFDSFPLGITVADSAGRIIESNPMAEELLGLTREGTDKLAIDGEAWHIVRSDGTPMPAEEYPSVRALKEHRPVENVEMGTVKAHGDITWISVTAAPLPLEGYGVVIAYGDITERKRAEDELAQSHDLLTNLARLVPGVIYQYRLDPDGRSAFPYSSPGMNDIYEVTPEEVREDATPVFARLHPDDYDYVANSIQESARTLQTFYCEFRVVLPRQGLRWRWSQAHPERTADGGTLWHGIISDITERKQIEAQLKEASNHDPLTGLYNRRLFEEEMALLDRGRRFPVSIVMSDLNHLKMTNDRDGHAAGDALLQRAAQILSASFRAEDIIARIGGDEFAVLLPDTDTASAEQSVCRVRRAVDEHNAAHGGTPLSIAFGVTTAEQGVALTDALKDADAQMYLDKRGS